MFLIAHLPGRVHRTAGLVIQSRHGTLEKRCRYGGHFHIVAIEEAFGLFYLAVGKIDAVNTVDGSHFNPFESQVGSDLESFLKTHIHLIGKI